MTKLDYNIYGMDTNDTAEACAAAALANPHPAKYGGAAIDNAMKSESSSDKSLKLDVESEQAMAKVTKLGLGDTSKARTTGNHGKQG